MALPKGEESYDILKTFEFTPERKTMSVVVRSVSDNKYHVFVKGADSAMLPMARGVMNDQQIEQI